MAEGCRRGVWWWCGEGRDEARCQRCSQVTLKPPAHSSSAPLVSIQASAITPRDASRPKGRLYILRGSRSLPGASHRAPGAMFGRHQQFSLLPSLRHRELYGATGRPSRCRKPHPGHPRDPARGCEPRPTRLAPRPRPIAVRALPFIQDFSCEPGVGSGTVDHDPAWRYVPPLAMQYSKVPSTRTGPGRRRPERSPLPRAVPTVAAAHVAAGLQREQVPGRG